MTAGRPCPLVRSNRRVVISVMLSMSLSVTPFFFMGAFGPDIQASLGLSEVVFGTIASLYFIVPALFSFPAGHVGELRGPRWSISVAAVGIAASLVGIALARNALQLGGAVLIGGFANTLTQPGGNMALARAIVPERLGMALALKQSSIPAAAMASGLAVATVGSILGWRPAIAIVGLLGGVVVVYARVIPRGDNPESSRGLCRRAPGSLRQLMPLAAAGVCGSAATTGMVAFFVDSAIRGGVSKGSAGVWWAVAGVAGITGRMLAGWFADRSAGRINIAWALAGFWLIGAVGFVLLAVADSWLMRVVATVPAFVFGWGWNGMFHHATVQWSSATPSWGTGVTQTGLSIGGSFGPVLFGAVLGVASFRVGWLLTAGLMVIAAALVIPARRSAAIGSPNAAVDSGV